MTRSAYENAKQRALALYDAAHMVLTEKEKDGMEIVDFGLNDFAQTGLTIVTYVNTEKCCAKEMVLLTNQTCPEHRHAPVEGTDYTGKEETFRCRFGTVYLYVEGAPSRRAQGERPSRE